MQSVLSRAGLSAIPENVRPMEQPSDDEPLPDIRWLVEMVGIRKVFVEQIGLRRVIEEIGLGRVIEEIGWRRLVDEIGLERLLDELVLKAAQLTPEERADLIRRLQG